MCIKMNLELVRGSKERFDVLWGIKINLIGYLRTLTPIALFLLYLRPPYIKEKFKLKLPFLIRRSD